MALDDPRLLELWKRAMDASIAAAGAEKAERAHKHAMLRARAAMHRSRGEIIVNNYKALIAIGQLDA